MAAWMRPGREKDQASEGEEEEEEEEGEEAGGGLWEYDSTWEEEEKEEEEKEEGRREKKEREPASQAAHLEEAREMHSWWSPSSKWASASQEWRRPSLSAGGVKKWKSISRRNWDAARDLQKYRRHYPGLEETELNEEDMWNLSFYKNEINFLPREMKKGQDFGHNHHHDLFDPPVLLQCFQGLPKEEELYFQGQMTSGSVMEGIYEEDTGMEDQGYQEGGSAFQERVQGLYIEDLLETWQDKYEVLEENHSYIQWLFPLREQGMNFHAKRLTRQEIEAFKKSEEVMKRFVRAYKLMLSFYGVNLINKETGELRRAENWSDRFMNLNQYSHNNLRITRILKCLGEMGYEHYQVQLVKFFLIETLVHQELPRVMRSALDYFMFTIRNKPKRRELVYFAWQHFKPKCEFVWGPHKKLRRFKPQSVKFLSNPEEQAHIKKEDEEVVEKDNIESSQKIFQRLMEKPGLEGARETLEKEKDGLSVENSVAEHDLDTTINRNHTEQPGSNNNAKLNLSASNSVQDTGSRRRVTSVQSSDLLQDGEVLEPQIKPVGDCKTSRKANQPHFALVTVGETEKEDSEEGTVSSDCPLEGKDHADECVGEAEGENLKESKKRKLEMSKLSGESSGVSKSPSDIERISHNLGEVVITKEEVSTLAPKGGNADSRVGKEAGSLDAVIKRRKVDMAPKGGSSKVDDEVILSKSQGISSITHDVKKTDPVCQEETKTAVNASVDTLTGPRAGGVDILADSKKNDLPVDGCLLENVKEQEAPTLTESEAPWLSETFIAHKRGVRNNAGWKEQDTEETFDGSTGRNNIPKIKEHENTMGGPEKE
ncbi:opioid growth factor receptor-like protein 1 isoform X1 [Python bivittatus]|uniref:Opioid growth factor receptor-like protein 1 isoform X1 n=1 Tax=Python bivittatus TaxID=176946 RepID=A0A9F5JDV7_PYTBI|nr:opioid growth factor receptor-like protein 1 isoform X1 [Python bivittatus]XP_025031397.1 opioid growth factor receptor-like protein 1 isoform X1 [Python bivittatus]